MTIQALNALSQSQFVDAVGWVFEHSPWVAERAWASRPFGSVEALHAAMREQVEGAGPDEKLALLCAHPDLGTRARLTAASASEQAGAGLLDQLQPSESQMLLQFNTDYRTKFGFPFIYAVKGSPPSDILVALTIRLNSSFEEEFHEALYQVYRIAFFRLEQVVDSPGRS